MKKVNIVHISLSTGSVQRPNSTRHLVLKTSFGNEKALFWRSFSCRKWQQNYFFYCIKKIHKGRKGGGLFEGFSLSPLPMSYNSLPQSPNKLDEIEVGEWWSAWWWGSPPGVAIITQMLYSWQALHNTSSGRALCDSSFAQPIVIARNTTGRNYFW